MKKLIALILTIPTLLIAGIQPRQNYVSDTSETVKRRSITVMQGTSWDLGWGFSNKTTAANLTGATPYFYFSPSSRAWVVTVTGSVENASNGAVVVNFTPAQLNTNGSFDFVMEVVSNATVLGYAYGNLTILENISDTAVAPLPAGTNFNYDLYTTYTGVTNGALIAGSNITFRAGSNGRYYIDNGIDASIFLPLAGGTMTAGAVVNMNGGVLTNLSHATVSNFYFATSGKGGSDYTTTSPADNDIALAGWVRSLTMQGQEWFFTSSVSNFGGIATTNFVALDTTIPTDAFTNSIASPVASDTYLVGGIATQLFGELRSPITFEMYLNRVGGNASSIIPVHPEIYYVYQGTTNALGDWETADQTVTATTPTRYTFTVAFADPMVTGAVHVLAYLKSGTVSGTAAGLNIVGGNGYASHMNIEGVSQADVDKVYNMAEMTNWNGSVVDGDLNMNGSHSVTNVNTVKGATGHQIDMANGRIYDSNGKTSVNWSVRTAFDTDNILSIDWTSRYIYDESSAPALEWAGRNLYGEWAIDSNALDTTDIVNYQTMTNHFKETITNLTTLGFTATGFTNYTEGIIYLNGTNYSYVSFYTNATDARTNLYPLL